MKRLDIIIAVIALLSGLISNAALATPIPGTEIIVTASSDYSSDRSSQNTINGSGLSGTFPNQTHGVDPYTMWITNLNNDLTGAENDGIENAWIQFDLGVVYNLASAHIWNYNEFWSGSPYTARGINEVDIYISTIAAPGDPEGAEASNWKLLPGNTNFPQATGSPDYAGFTLEFGNIEARYVRFEIDSNYSIDTYGDFVGLSEIQFTPAPVPEPATMLLLGSGLIGVGVFIRKKFKK